MSPDKKLKYLSDYIGAFVDAYPKKIKPFDRWIESTVDKKKHKGKLAEIAHHKNICRYCCRTFENNYIEKTKDHIIPISKGGFDLKENRVPCCFDCNQWKSDKTLDCWLSELQRIVKKEKKIRPPYNKGIVGVMIGKLKHVINEAKNNQSKISTYKV